MTRVERVLLGTALGDSLGLVFEGLSASRVAKFSPVPLRQRLFLGRGALSDDTLQSIFVAQAIRHHPDDPAAAARFLGRRLRRWFWTLPPGIGLSTAKACLGLTVGIQNSGVPSAGNGSAMRSAVVGVMIDDPDARDAMVETLSRITHTHPAAILGAQLVAFAAACGDPLVFDELAPSRYPSWDFSASFRSRGPTGYVVETVQAALAVWRTHPRDAVAAIEAALRLGGDTDSVAAIVGGLVGAGAEVSATPELTSWIGWPQANELLSDSVPWGRVHLAHALTLPVVLGHGFRRMLPPYG